MLVSECELDYGKLMFVCGALIFLVDFLGHVTITTSTRPYVNKNYILFLTISALKIKFYKFECVQNGKNTEFMKFAALIHELFYSTGV